MTSDADAFRVLFVCTGNICRSRIAEQVLRSHYDTDSVSFQSAGVGAMVGMEMPAQAVGISQKLGGSPDGHVGRSLTPALIANADIVIALTRGHRSEIVRSLPRASRSTFTLREIARLLDSLVLEGNGSAPHAHGTVPEVLRSFIPQIAAQRGYAQPPASPEDDDVVDPYRQSQAIYDLCGAQIDDAITRIIAAVSSLGGVLR